MLATAAYAQNITVTGVVKDSSTGEPVPFASIRLDGTMIGGMTDLDGIYSIDVPADGLLIFSSIGYKDTPVPVEGKTQHDVMLDPDTQMLEETIVVAFGTATKESFTGSATVVKSEDITKVQSSDVTRALEGMVAGVQMTTSSGSLGSSPSIQIRGTSSISAGTAPLYVVDGVPYSGDMNNLNSADIESMTVLKDAASNALYGARGANGVIMITTKKAKRGEASVTVDAKWGLNTKALRSYEYIKDPKLYYEAHYTSLYNYYRMEQGMSDTDANLKAAANVAGSSDVGGLGYLTYTLPEGQNLIGTNGKFNPNATFGRKVLYNGEYFWLQPDDWMAESYRNSLRQEYNVSASGSPGGNAQIFASFGYLNNKGLIQGEDMERYTARVRIDYQIKVIPISTGTTVTAAAQVMCSHSHPMWRRSIRYICVTEVATSSMTRWATRGMTTVTEPMQASFVRTQPTPTPSRNSGSMSATVKEMQSTAQHTSRPSSSRTSPSRSTPESESMRPAAQASRTCTTDSSRPTAVSSARATDDSSMSISSNSSTGTESSDQVTMCPSFSDTRPTTPHQCRWEHPRATCSL